MKIKISYIIIAALVAIIIFMSKCGGGKFIPTGNSDTQYIEIEKWDTFNKTDTVLKPKWKKITMHTHDTLIDSIPYPVYADVVLTEDSLIVKNDSTNVLVTYKIYSHDPLYKIEKNISLSVKRKQIKEIITNEVIRKNALFVGPSIGVGRNNGFISLNGLYEHKGKTIYGLGVGVTNRVQPIIKAGIYWQILK
jgi:hypothetical protein